MWKAIFQNKLTFYKANLPSFVQKMIKSRRYVDLSCRLRLKSHPKMAAWERLINANFMAKVYVICQVLDSSLWMVYLKYIKTMQSRFRDGNLCFRDLYVVYTSSSEAGHFAERHFAERHFAERHFAERHFTERHFAERHFAERTFCRRRRTFCRTDNLPKIEISFEL